MSNKNQSETLLNTDSGFLNVNLDDLVIENVDLFLEEGSRGLPDFGASCNCPPYSPCMTNSCSTTPAPEIEVV